VCWIRSGVGSDIPWKYVFETEQINFIYYVIKVTIVADMY